VASNNDNKGSETECQKNCGNLFIKHYLVRYVRTVTENMMKPTCICESQA